MRPNPNGKAPPDNAAPGQREFARTLTDILATRGISHRDLATGAGLGSHTRLYRWLDCTVEPPPRDVFAIEDWLELKKGYLSLILGYDRPGLRGRPPVLRLEDALDVIDGDPTVPDGAKRLVRMTIDEFKVEKNPRRR